VPCHTTNPGRFLAASQTLGWGIPCKQHNNEVQLGMNWLKSGACMICRPAVTKESCWSGARQCTCFLQPSSCTIASFKHNMWLCQTTLLPDAPPLRASLCVHSEKQR
jgi:hypothetical protein